MIARVTIVGRVTDRGFRVTESYFHIGRRVMDRKRWIALSHDADPKEA